MGRRLVLLACLLCSAAHPGVLMATGLDVGCLTVDRHSNELRIHYCVENRGEDWLFLTNISTPTFLLQENRLFVQMYVFPPPSRVYLGDEFGAIGKAIEPGGQTTVDLALTIDRFENTPYLTSTEIGLLHKGEDLDKALTRLSEVILRIGFVTCDSPIAVPESREWKPGDNLCGAPLQYLQGIAVKRISWKPCQVR